MSFLNTTLVSTLLNTTRDIIILLSQEKVVLRTNHVFEKIFPKYADIIGKNFLDILSDAKPPIIELEFNLLLSKKTLDQKIETSNGEIFYFSWSLESIIDEEQNTIFIIIGNDITDSKHIAFLNKQNQAQLERISSCVPGNFYWKNAHGEYLGCNLSLLSMLGFHSIEEIIGKNDYDLWPEQADEIRKHDKQVMLLKKAVSGEESVKIADKNMYFTVIKMPLFGENDEIIGILGNSLDITPQKNMEEELRKAKEIAETASNAKTEFIANMSHDIRTPLSGVVGLGMLAEQEIESPSPKTKVHDMVKSAEELLNMLNKFLDVVALGNITVNNIHEEPFDLHHLVQAIVDLEQASVDLKKIQLLTFIDDNIPPVLIGDHDKIHHVILNLVGNSIKFTKTGHVDINIKLIETLQDKVKVLFQISDTGMGISENDLHKIFEAFYKVTPSYKGLDKGHGVGLHIVKTYTELLGGKISVESKLNEGSKFSFTLTIKIADKNHTPQNLSHTELLEQSDKSFKSAPPMSQHLPNAPELLIIEDSPIALTIAQTLVQQTKCNTTPASDGESALALAKNIHFDLILSDVGLPGISGVEFTQQLRDFEKLHNKTPVPIVAVTAHAEGKMHDECIAAGMNDVAIKPLSIEKLTQIYNKFSLFDAQASEPANNALSSSSGLLQISPLAADLPNTEDELFALEHILKNSAIATDS